ncbi:carboxypeptidase-like regulatory domain-containing protein [Hymenobacter cellulosilyticus]|uniref:Carboxypeptidase-like regulatory domain-containing protein n=1 Tax=Hymenobacter cellulosilyticus TaxID=2932248 RepID=A0A8T9Q282_9BACT|nr:carboxypeptidase-like regulatory domain-containing protein [Hymenobacter cellulosilyticus]UOQ70571.1 carboxypeptidase-like regulatory domain-containing protein [Hymenobacter cellulosilyticus]
MSTSTPSNEPQTDEAALLASAEEEYSSSGNGKLAIIVGAIVLFAGLGYAFVPVKTAQTAISSVMPSFVLGDATVTGSRPVEETPTEEVAEEEAVTAAAPAPAAAKPAARPAATGAVAAQPVRPSETALAEALPELESAAPAAAAPAEPANVTLSGRILDENGRPLAGATVLVKGSRKGTGTDANGNYTLEVPAGDNTLVYGYGGYEDQEMRARGGQPLNVTLTPAEGGRRRRR